MGHIVSQEGVKVDPKKFKSMMDWLIPKNLKNIQGFLGLTRYYSKFVQNYGRIAAPLTTLLKKDAFLGLKRKLEPFNNSKGPCVKLLF